MKASPALTAILAVTFFCSCSHYYYTPMIQNVPLLAATGDGNLSLSYGAGEESNSIGGSASYALSNHLAVMADFTALSGGDKSDDKNWGHGSYYEGAAGYFTSVNQQLIFNLYGGIGHGSQDHRYSYYDFGYMQRIPDGTSSLTLTKLFLQPSIGVKYNSVECAFSSQLIRLNFNDITESIISSNTYGLDLITENKPIFLIEPCITLRAGSKNIKGQFQYIYSIHLTNTEYLFEKSKISLGIFFSFSKRVK